MYVYPYGDSQQLNLDWIINKLKKLEDREASAADLEQIANVFIALTHSSGTQYRRYDYCYYQDKLYRALNNNIGAFNASDWMEVRLGDDIPVLTRLINAIDAAAVVDVIFDTSGTNGKLQQKYNNDYHDVVEVDYTPVENSKRPLSSNAGYELNDAINPLKTIYQKPTWTIGSLSTATGVEAEATNQIRSDFIRCDTGTRIACDSGYQFIVCMYNIDTMVYENASGSWQSSEYVLNDKKWIRILVRKTDQSTIADAKTVAEYLYIGDYEIHNNIVTGSDSNGNYIKYGDGTLIQFGTKLPTVNMTSSWGALYYGEAPSMTFPLAFIARPVVTIGVGYGQSAIVMSCNPSTTGISNLQFCRGTSANGTVIYDWIAIGRWK